jgi:hypothetical protein
MQCSFTSCQEKRKRGHSAFELSTPFLYGGLDFVMVFQSKVDFKIPSTFGQGGHVLYGLP